MAAGKTVTGQRNPSRNEEPASRSGPEKTYEGIVNVITADYPRLSERFQQVARYLTQNPNVVALESASAIAAKCGVHASILVRFAQHFRYSGFKALQLVFQGRLATAAPGFQERIKALDAELQKNLDGSHRGFLRNQVVRDLAALQTLLETISEESLQQGARCLKEAEIIYIAGQHRSEPLALFTRYVLTMLRRRVVLLDSGGGLATEIASIMSKRDVLVAIAFRHYAKEVLTIAERAAANGTPMIAITDSPLSPLAKDASVLFTIPEEEYSFSRSLAAPMSLVQTIAVSLAALLEQDEGKTPARRRVRSGKDSKTRPARS